ncbi:acyl-CoA dehydrogenase family protein [Nocardia sp. NPDC056000]|uniref:acyl-CoA dehydrogenase family protein n=1 Tax=Nocardia sp. NPDC056000 TaxID=3345674 RepID=UPI0035D91BC6
MLEPKQDDDFGRLLDEVFDADFQAVTDAAEKTGRFPRELIERLGSAGIFASKWQTQRPDVAKLVMLSERLGGVGSASIAVGVSLHDSAIAVLRRFGRSDYLRDIADRAVAGTAVVCLGASEARGGSDLQNADSIAIRTENGYRLRGAKKFVSLSTIADVIILVVRVVPEDGAAASGGEVALFAVEADRVEIGEPYAKLGAHCLETAPIEFDVEVTEDAMIARPGTGLAILSWGLANERLSVAGQVVGACDLALGVTVAEMMRRTQFGKQLFEHQALRLRLADLRSRVDVLRYALLGLAAAGETPTIRTASAFKVTAARLGEEVISECLHIFGGTGYLTGVAPVEKWWRDMKLARTGGGTDEVLWELVAAGMRPDYDNHDRLVKA